MASEGPRRLTTPAPIGAVERFETPQTLPPLPIEIFASRDLEDSSTEMADNNDRNNEQDNNNNNNEEDEEDDESNKDDDLPSYLHRLVTQLENIDLDDVREDSVEGLGGGDSDVESDD